MELTCIIGLEHEGKVYIGGDSCGTNGWEIGVLSTRKVFRVGEFLIGYSGSLRQLNLLRYAVHPRPQEEDESDERYVVRGLIESIRQCFKDNGSSKIDNNLEDANSMMLVGFHGKLYQVGSMFDVAQFERGYAGVGAGGDYALGSLITQMKTACAMEKRADGSLTVPEPEVLLKRALDVAAMMSGAVCPPFVVESI